MPFTSPFGGLGLTAFNPASPNLPQNVAAKPKAAPETPVPTKPTTPAGAETITALVRPSLVQPARAAAPMPEAPAFASVPQLAMPEAYAPTPPLPSFASAPSPYALAEPTMPALPMAARRSNPNRLIFV
jgi:hypothetical protein